MNEKAIFQKYIIYIQGGFKTLIPYHQITSYSYHEGLKKLYINVPEEFIITNVCPQEFFQFNISYTDWLEGISQ